MKIIFTENGDDIAVDLRNGKANGFGWSTYEVWHTKDVGAFAPLETQIADLYCGDVKNLKDGFSYRMEEI